MVLNEERGEELERFQIDFPELRRWQLKALSQMVKHLYLGLAMKS